MAGLFDGMRTSTSGIHAHRILQEVVGNNIAQASNENYSRQKVDLSTLGSQFDGRHFFGQGVKVDNIQRVRDELLDGQLRVATGSAALQTEKSTWLNRVQSAFNEPSDVGINASLSDFWDSWSNLANDPESLPGRSEVLTKSENLARQLRNTSSRLSDVLEDVDQSLKLVTNEINSITAQIASLNKDIFEAEAGGKAQANDLRDKRDALLDDLAEQVDFRAYEDTNGMVNVLIAEHPAVMRDKAERLVAENDSLDASKLTINWEWGSRLNTPVGGKLAALVEMRETVIPDFQQQLHDIASTIISQVNSIYSNGVALQPKTLMESNLGYEALGVSKSTDALNLVPSGQEGEIHLSFYDASGDLVRTQGIVVDAGDSLADIANKLDTIRGIQASVLSSPDNDGRLSIQLDGPSGENTLGEVSFAVSNNNGGYDSSGVLELLGFSQTAKSTNSSAVAPLLASRDLSELQSVLQVPDVATVRTTALNLAGTFTINAFETGSEDAPKTNGHHVQQFAIEVVSSDTIDSIMAKVNALTANHGISMSFNGGTNQLELTSSARTDSEGNVQLAGGSDYLRLAFANDYRYPAVVNDEQPDGYTGLGDNTGLFGAIQLNTLFSGSDADSIDVDRRVSTPSALNAAHALKSGDNRMAQAMNALQHARIGDNGQFTIGETYGNYIASIGTDINRADELAENENLLLDNYLKERSSISGVNLDEELALMIQFQRSYEANARMFSTFNQMAQELLQII